MNHLTHDTPIIGFDHQPRTRLIFGANSIDHIATHIADWNGKHALLVTDPHIVEAGHAPRAHQALEAAGIAVTIFDQTRENPTTEDVDACLAVAKSTNIDTIIGIGGGSTLDTAKGCNFLLTNGGEMKDYWGVGKADKPMLPLIAVPTTAGTGSECQSFALIADAETHMKMACGDPKASPRIAILDPTLTLTQPRMVTADTAADALTHAVETAVTTKRTEFSMMYSREAFRLIVAALPRVLENPDDLDARGRMQLAAAYAGFAIENSMLGAAHAAANPLTAHFGVIHGQAVALMLPSVVRFNAEQPDARRLYAKLAVSARLVAPTVSDDEAIDALLQCVNDLFVKADLPASLSETGVEVELIPTLASEAARQWTAQFNPREISEHDFIHLYQSIYSRQTVTPG